MPHDKVTSPTATMNGGALLEDVNRHVQAIRCTYQKHRVSNVPPHALKNDCNEESTICWRITSVQDKFYLTHLRTLELSHRNTLILQKSSWEIVTPNGSLSYAPNAQIFQSKRWDFTLFPVITSGIESPLSSSIRFRINSVCSASKNWFWSGKSGRYLHDSRPEAIVMAPSII